MCPARRQTLPAAGRHVFEDIVRCAGASGKLDRMRDQEYGAQDFYGAIDELRIWRTVRTQDQIKQVRQQPSQSLQ